MSVGHQTRSATQPCDRGQRLGEARRIAAAGHRHVGLAAALAADLLGDEVDELAGLDPADAVGGDAGGDLHPRAVDRGQHDDRGLELVLELVERVAQRLGVGAVEPRGQHLQALDVDRLRAPGRRPATRPAGP